MSADQKPERIRAVAGASVAAANPGGETAGETAGGATSSPNTIQPVASTRPSLVAILLFLLGCGAGGAAVAALPHFIGAH